jgi:hypothetical protein
LFQENLLRTFVLSSLILLSLINVCSPVVAQTPPQSQIEPVSDLALANAVKAKDAALFKAVFETCDASVIGDLVTDDLEFYHDQWGRIAASKAEFLHVTKRQCDGWSKPGALRSRRVLDEKNLAIYPIPGFGASETGTHRFYELQENGTQKLVGIAQFTMVWKGSGTDLRLSRVISYAHQDF